jgi:hypothetical protein
VRLTLRQNGEMMSKTQVWSLPDEEVAHVVVLKDDVAYSAQIKLGEFAAILKDIEEGNEPPAMFGKGATAVPLGDITSVVADNTSNLVLKCGRDVAMKVPLKQEGIKVLEAIQDAKGRGWEVDIQARMRIGSAIMALLIGIVMGGGMVWAYFGVVSGQIQRIHWLFAWLINTFGPVVLLITAALIVIGAMWAFGYYLTHPAEVWTLEEG